MNKILQIAIREFVATVATRAFIIGLLIMPAMITVGILVVPRLFNFNSFQVKGQLAIVDTTGQVIPELRTSLDTRQIVARRAEQTKAALEQAPESVRQMGGKAALDAAAQVPVPEVTLVELPATADVQKEKLWLTEEKQEPRHLALVVIHEDAVIPSAGKSAYGTYDLYVPPGLDDRVDREIQESLRNAIINARIRSRSLDRATIDSIVSVPRPRSITVTRENERQTVGALNILLPVSVGALLFIGVMTGGQALLTSTVEEKSSRVIEVLLSAVSPRQLMAGKLVGQMGVSLVALGLYIALGLAMVSSFSLFGLFNPWLIFYLLVFFVIMYLVMGSLMMAIGAAVNEMREAQSLMMPIMLVLMLPWFLWMPISRDPNSTFSIALSFTPPINTFAMLLRMASTTPPPWWQVWLSIAVGVASVFAAIWFAAKVFRIGLLMYGKPPNFATLIRWVRSA
jgi:ABC-type Na+ efflux pump permease subunit